MTSRTPAPRDFSAGKAGFALRLFRLRFHSLNMTQRQFADRFGLSYGMVRDLEQGRSQPSRPVLLYVAAIETFPELMAVIGNRWRSGAIEP